MSLAFKEIFSTCHFSSCHVFERSYIWLTIISIFAFKLEGYTFNIHADWRVFSERLSKRTTKNEQATIVFIDSFQFMSSRLDRLVNNLPAEAFKYTSEVFQGDRLKLMTKGHVTRGTFFLQRNGVSSCLLQEKSPPVTLLVCKIIQLQVIQQLAYVYNSTGAWNIFFTQICVPSCKKKLPRVTAP